MKIVIAGAGIAGLALAHRLQDAHDVTVVERSPGPREQGYMIDFFGPGYDAAASMGLLPRILELGYDVEQMRYVDEHGRTRVSFAFSAFADAVGGRLTSIMRPDLERAVREQVKNIRYGTALTAAEPLPEGVRVGLDDGTSLDADLLVGADGIHSTVRRLLFGEEHRYLRRLGFHTAAFVFDAPRVRKLMGDAVSLTDTMGRQMGFYGLRDGRVATFAVHRSDDTSLPADRREAVRTAYGSLGWIVPEVLAACPPDDEIYYDEVAQIEMPAWHEGRTVLLGDACGAVSLLAGQGASLGIAGAYVLAGQIQNAPDVGTALRRYEERWRPTVEAKQRTARRGAEWFLPTSKFQLALRRQMLRLGGVPGFKKLFAGALAGKPGIRVEKLAG